jgi:hypothetical protein
LHDRASFPKIGQATWVVFQGRTGGDADALAYRQLVGTWCLVPAFGGWGRV